MNIFTLTHILEPIITTGARIYAVAGEVFTITTLLYGLKLMSGLIETTYKAGFTFGKFYRHYLHEHLKASAIAVIAFVILVCQLTFEGAQLVYNNRVNILNQLKQSWNNLERAFVYESPTLA